MSAEGNSNYKCSNINEAVEVLRCYQRRCDIISNASRLSSVSSVTEDDAMTAKQLSDALEFATDSLCSDVKWRKEARRFKRKYLELKLAVIRALHVVNESATDPERTDHEVLASIVSCFRENFSYLFNECYDGSVESDDSSGS